MGLLNRIKSWFVAAPEPEVTIQTLVALPSGQVLKRQCEKCKALVSTWRTYASGEVQCISCSSNR